MPVDVIVPPLSQTMDTVILAQWLKAVGEPVAKGEPLFSIETDKATLEIESPSSGVVGQILVSPGSEVAVRSKVGVILLPAETSLPPALIAAAKGASPPQVESGAGVPSPAIHAGVADLQALPPERRERIFASPRARKLAEQAGAPLADLTPTGPQGMIVERDVRAHLRNGERAVPQPESCPADSTAEWVSLSSTRRTIARRMTESHQQAASVTLMREVDATELVRLREQILGSLSDGDSRPTYTDILVSVVAQQLKLHPYMNALVEGEGLRLSSRVHMALAVDAERGLVTPVLRNADRKRFLELARERRELVQRAQTGQIMPEEMDNGTFTITNLGALGIDAFTPIINPPQVAILGMGRIRPAPAIHDGAICIRYRMVLSLTFDHRFVDGAPAARFLQAVAETIEKPYLML